MDSDLENKIALIKRLQNDSEALELIGKLQTENKALKEQVIYWETFFSETIRLFGETKAELRPTLLKAQSVLHLTCWATAKDITKGQVAEPGRLNVAKLSSYHDIETRREFSRKIPLRQIVLEYLSLINDPPPAAKQVAKVLGMRSEPLSRIEAAQIIKDRRGYPEKLSSFVALLERNAKSIKKLLPSRRTIENLED